MASQLILTGDVNLMNVTDARVPFRKVAAHLEAADVVFRGHTAYHVPMGRISPDSPPANRPGVPPLIVTWADADYVKEFCRDIAALRPQVDIVVASCHWGLSHEPLQYMTEIAHAAI